MSGCFPFLDIEIEFHSNGDRGVPFHVVLFTAEAHWRDGLRRNVGVAFSGRREVAVLDVEKLGEGDPIWAASEGSETDWRDLAFNSDLREAIRNWELESGRCRFGANEKRPKKITVLHHPKLLRPEIQSESKRYATCRHHRIIFSALLDGALKTMVAVVFPKQGEVAVLDVEKIWRGDIGCSSNAWPGDLFEPGLREAIMEKRTADNEMLRTILGDVVDGDLDEEPEEPEKGDGERY